MNGVSCTTLQKRVISGDFGKLVRLIFVEVLSSAIHPVNMTSEHKIATVIRNNFTLEITEQASASF